jgi:hypothetical protein
MNKFNCTVCGVPVGRRGGALLGIEIHESFPSNQSSVSAPSTSTGLLRQQTPPPTLTSIAETELRLTQPQQWLLQGHVRTNHAYGARYKQTRVCVWFRHTFPDIAPDVHFDQKILANTMKEATLLSRLRHPSIISLIGTTIFPEGPALVLEPTFCTVASALENGPKSISFGVRVAAQIASAVDYLHGNRLYQCAADIHNVCLLHASEQDPCAKLSNLSRCRRGNPKSDSIQDVESLGVFIGLLFRGEVNVLKGTIKDSDSPSCWEELHESYGKIAPIIRGTSERTELTASEIAFEFARLDVEVEVGSTRLMAWVQSRQMPKISV